MASSGGTNECEVVTTPKGPRGISVTRRPPTNIHMYDFSLKVRRFELQKATHFIIFNVAC